jgi:hypothetical protein
LIYAEERTNVDVVEQKDDSRFEAPLLLRQEKEREDEAYYKKKYLKAFKVVV